MASTAFNDGLAIQALPDVALQDHFDPVDDFGGHALYPWKNGCPFSQETTARVTMASLGDKYKKLSHREHVLELPDTYIGSIDTHPQEV